MVSNPGALLVNPLDPSEARFGECGGRVSLVDASEIEFAVYSSNVVEINGENVDIDDITNCQVLDLLIQNDGSNSGLGPAGSTRLYAYVSNSLDTNGNALRLRLSSSAPSIYNGFYYLNSTGNGCNWRFVGWVGTDSVPAFRDDQSARLICNFYNRLRKDLLLNPNYTDGNTQTTIALNTATWARVNAGTGDTGLFVSNGEDAVDFSAQFSIVSSGAAIQHWGIGTSATSARVAAVTAASAANVTAFTRWCEVLTDGFYSVYLLGMTGGTATTLIVDVARNGSTADPRATQLRGMVMT